MSNILNHSSSVVSPKILLVKLSSLGDVLHNLPIVWDLRARLPNAQVDWVVEEAYVHLLEPLLSHEGFRGIDRIISSKRACGSARRGSAGVDGNGSDPKFFDKNPLVLARFVSAAW